MNRFKFFYSVEGQRVKKEQVVVAESEEKAWEKFGSIERDKSTEVDDVIDLGEDRYEDPNQLSLFNL